MDGFPDKAKTIFLVPGVSFCLSELLLAVMIVLDVEKSLYNQEK